MVAKHSLFKSILVWVVVLVCWVAVTKYHRLGGFAIRNPFPHRLEAQSPGQGASRVGFWRGLSSWLVNGTFSSRQFYGSQFLDNQTWKPGEVKHIKEIYFILLNENIQDMLVLCIKNGCLIFLVCL